MEKARKSLTVLLVGFAAVVTVPDRSLGGSISYTVDAVGNGYVQLGFLPQFDPSLGTLTAVTYSGTETVYTEFVLDQLQSSVSYDASAQFLMVGGGGAGSTFYSGNTLGTVAVESGSYFVDVSANVNVSGNFGVPPYLGYDQTFYGCGVFNVQVVQNITLNVPAYVAPYGNWGADGEITFTYTYTPYGVVPEPPGLVLASISAFLPFCLILKRAFTKRSACV